MKLFGKKKEEASSIEWASDANAAITQALDQAPIPKMLRGQVKKQLRPAADKTAKAAGASSVQAQHVMEGLLTLLPAGMRDQVESAIKSGDPNQLRSLQKRFGGK